MNWPEEMTVWIRQCKFPRFQISNSKFLISNLGSRLSRENLLERGLNGTKIPVRYPMETDLIQQCGPLSP